MATSPYKKPFTKEAETATQLVERILNRGLTVTDEEKQELYGILQSVGYYRFTGFCLPFQQKHPPNKGKFQPNTNLSAIMALYQFDTELRALCGQALEKIEIYIRNVICDHMSRTHNAHWHIDQSCFSAKFDELHAEAAKNVLFDLSTNTPKGDLRNHQFLTHYYGTYDTPPMPPAWMHRECASFGYWSKAYTSIPTADQKEIAKRFRFPNRKPIDAVLLQDWLRSVSIFRNRCAHHARITNRKFPFEPNAPTSNPVTKAFVTDGSDLRTLLLVIAILIRHIAPKFAWRVALRALLERTANVNIVAATGIGAKSGGWQNDPLWDVENLT
ncbi:Abi family protein [Ralstonia pseudosolanacearum]|uniref:Abi family protein n=1 Tax=Ralstonia pseudosolanacearum TaxID=1310165 RepID=UPI003CE75E63